MADEKSTPKKGWFQKGNRKVIAITAGTVIAVGSAFGVQALANSKTGAHMMLLASDGGSWRAGWHGRRFHGGLSNMTDAEIEKKVDRMVKHVAIEIDATPEQQTKISKLFIALAKDLKPMRGQMRDSGRQVHDLLLANKIDREALEKIRTARLADAERLSKAIVNAVADAAEILSPEQRKVLEERIKYFRSMRRGWGHGWRHGWHRG
ncbi:MAG: Spy/CpxP family protein refolding chaperone [Hyphomicrobiaceae bacterium]